MINRQVRDGAGNVVQKKNWVVTAYDYSRTKGIKKREAPSSGTLTTPPANPGAGGVTLPPNEAVSEGKGNEGSSEKQDEGVREILNDKSYEERVSRHGHERESREVYFTIINNLHKVLRNSVECEIHPDAPKNDKGVREGSSFNEDVIVHQFYGAVHCDGFPALSRVRFMIKENRTATREGKLYTFELTKIELLDESNNSIYGREEVYAKGIATHLALAKVLHGVEKFYDKGEVFT